MPSRSILGKLTNAVTKKEFGNQLSSYTTLTADEIRLLFPKKSDREGLIELLEIVNSNAEDNIKKSQLIEKIDKIGVPVIKIAKKFAFGL